MEPQTAVYIHHTDGASTGPYLYNNMMGPWVEAKTLMDLAMQAQQSTEVVLAGRRTQEKIAQTRYNSRTGSVLWFITKFEEPMETYNLQQRNPGMVLTGPMMKSYLQLVVA